MTLVRGTGRSWVAWNAEALDQLLEAALLRYLAVAHFGRGRGEWAQGESPPHWRDVVQQALAPHRDTLDVIWKERDARGEADASADSTNQGLIAAALAPIVREALGVALHALYPDAPPLRESAEPTAMASQ